MSITIFVPRERHHLNQDISANFRKIPKFQDISGQIRTVATMSVQIPFHNPSMLMVFLQNEGHGYDQSTDFEQRRPFHIENMHKASLANGYDNAESSYFG